MLLVEVFGVTGLLVGVHLELALQAVVDYAFYLLWGFVVLLLDHQKPAEQDFSEGCVTGAQVQASEYVSFYGFVMFL